MEITINVAPEEFENKIKKGLEGFNEEELKELCRQGILKCLSDPKTFQQLFVGQHENYNYFNSYYSANDVLKEALKSVDLSEAFEDFKQKAIEYINNEHKNIINKMFNDMFIGGLVNTLQESSQFTNSIRDNIYMYMNERNN